MALITYCQVIWTWLTLHLLGLVKPSPLISLLIAAVFTVFHQSFYFEKAPLTRKIIIILFEFALAFIVYYKSGLQIDILVNAGVFSAYNIFLAIQGKTFADVYFKQIRDIGNRNTDIIQYVKDRANDIRGIVR